MKVQHNRYIIENLGCFSEDSEEVSVWTTPDAGFAMTELITSAWNMEQSHFR